MTTIIGFAHRGAPPTKSAANTLPAFARALTLGASGLETDVGLTADGIPVLTHTGISLRRGPRTGDLKRSELPIYIPSLEDLYRQCGINFELSLDMAQPRSAEAVVRVAEQAGAADRLWLTYWRLPELQAWRQRLPHVHLVYPTIPLRFRAASHLMDRLAVEGVDVLNVHHRFCRPRIVEYARSKHLRLFAWGIRSTRALQRAISLEVDGVYCDDVEMMVQALRQANGPLIRH